MRLLLIGLGGAVGSVLRYLLSGVVQSGAGAADFPIGTLAVNVLGCFVIGVLTELSESRGALDAEMRGLLVVGLLGGFTTFSTLANETLSAMRDRAMLVAAGNLVLSVVLGLLAVWLGRVLAHALWG
ncbi:MAG TPA: fluoride efflux transporter CrcB [Gemmatimonadales bacterium]